MQRMITTLKDVFPFERLSLGLVPGAWPKRAAATEGGDDGE
jgi:hypothetical protein